MQTVLHILNLVTELRRELIGAELVGTEYYKKERAAYFFFRQEKTRWALGFRFHPAGSGTFLVPASKITIDTTEKPWPMFGLSSGTVSAVEQLGLDRLFFVTLAINDEKKLLVFEAIGPNGNIWCLDSDRRKQATLRNREYKIGDQYDFPAPPARLDPFTVEASAMRERLTAEMPSMVTYVEKQLIGFTRTMAKEAVARAGIDFVEPSAVTDEQLATLARSVCDLAARFPAADSAYLYVIKGAAEVYPFKLSTVTDEPEKFKSLSQAVLAMTEHRQTVEEDADREKQVTGAVSRAIKRLEGRILKIEHDVTDAENFEIYKRYGELLQIHHAELKRGMSKITVDDIFLEPHQPVTIKLDPALPPSDNIDAYFKRHRKGREGLEILQRRLEVSRHELAELRTIAEALEINFDVAVKQFDSELQALLPREGERTKEAPRLPYREHQLSTGVTIFVGREGADNDRLTFEFAKPHELWFHAQQCPGSHVVMKFPNKSFIPSKKEIEETAAYAAGHSKARNDRLVPVIYTERRYVRKPRKAKPGLVTVEREKSVMVVPKRLG